MQTHAMQNTTPRLITVLVHTPLKPYARTVDLGRSATDINLGLDVSEACPLLVATFREDRVGALAGGFVTRAAFSKPVLSSSSVMTVVLTLVRSCSGSGTSDDTSVPCVLGGVSAVGESSDGRGASSLSGSETLFPMRTRRRVLFLLSARLIDRTTYSPSSSNDLLELELRCEEVAEALLARNLSPSWTRLVSTSLWLLWRKSWMISDDRSDLLFRMDRLLRSVPVSWEEGLDNMLRILS